MDESLTNIAARLVSQHTYMTIATVTEHGQPWNSPVKYYLDRSVSPFRLLWVSSTETQHSKNIAHHPDAFIVIYDSQALDGEGVGVYMNAHVQMLDTNEAVEMACRVLPLRDGEPNEYFLEGIHRIYEAIPDSIWMNDAEKISDVIFTDFRVSVTAS